MRKDATRELAETIEFTDTADVKALGEPTGPAVTIYIPIHHNDRARRRDDWDRIEFKDLMKEADRQLKERFSDPHEYKGITEAMEYILDNGDLPLWVEAKEGLAMFITNDGTQVFNLEVQVDPRAIVDDDFYTVPLVQDEEKMDIKYKLLLLNADFFSILDGNAEKVRYEKMPAAVKQYFAEEFADFDGDTTPQDYYSLEGHMSPYHDHRSRNDVKKEEAEKFFRYVNEAVHRMTDGDHTPMILVTLPEHVHAFREISTIRTLLPKGIEKDPRTLSGDRLREMAMEIIEAE